MQMNLSTTQMHDKIKFLEAPDTACWNMERVPEPQNVRLT